MREFGFDPENVTGKYVLDDEGEPVAEPNLMKWAMWMETGDRIVLRTKVGVAVVSTVFLGLDYAGLFFAGPDRGPVLWETMVFGKASAFDQWGKRYASKLDALQGHARWCEVIERFDAPRMPRRLKKTLKKHDRCARPGERRPVHRWHRRVAAALTAA